MVSHYGVVHGLEICRPRGGKDRRAKPLEFRCFILAGLSMAAEVSAIVGFQNSRVGGLLVIGDQPLL
jgi:hypothetical protein